VFSVVDVATDDIGAVITSLIYPMEDVVVIGLVVGVGMLLSWRLDRQMIVLFAGALAVTAADLIVATRVLNGDPLNGAWSNFGWTSGIALFAVAGWVQAQPPAVLLDRPLASHATVPAGASAVGLIIVTAGTVFDLSPVAEGFAVAAVAIGCVRMQLSFAEARALADSHRLALADELTDLPNRRRLMRDLRLAFETQAPSYLALYDLDGFKHFNDTHGHSDGDRLLISLATRLAETVGAVGTAYRLGGDEFCVLTPATEDGDAAIRAGGAALHATGADWRVGATYGVVEIPREVSTVGDAVRTADRRMYAEKDRRPVAARQQVRDVLLSALGEQQPTLHTHTQDVTAMAGAVARSLGMKPREVDEVVRAAELHDVGKLAIPATVLDKPGPLNDEEWDLIHQHTIIGERMLAAAASLRPVASLVRSSHERWDGHGYPDGLRGEQIPLGARIVAVCDSYDAMIAERPYQAGMPLHEALAEIRRCAGTQFDPAVVDAFVRIAEAGRSASARLS
jgi:diguanylate cyclase (GGDEF)-like protein